MANRKYPPYVNAYGKIAQLFQDIKKASVPTKFSQDFLSTILGYKSSSDRALIPLLKNLGFIDQANIPTQAYRDFRDETISGQVMANQIKIAYPEIFKASEHAYKLTKKELSAKLKTVLGVADDDTNLPSVAATFCELSKLADFNNNEKEALKAGAGITKKKNDGNETKLPETPLPKGKLDFGISYTINLNLPATTEIGVFNAIFKSLRDNLLNENE